MVEIEVTGPGISEKEQGLLFQYFVQTSSGVKKGSGTGLRLALSRELVNLMGGDIKVSSETGKGSLFSCNVEIKEGENENAQTISTKRVIRIEKENEHYRILVVDDNEENLKVVIELLILAGFETFTAKNGEDAIRKFENWSPQLISMDMRMPVMDGYEASRLIKSTEKGTKNKIQ
jgi:hypothetical protein